MAARFHQESWSSGKTRLLCRSRTKQEMKVNTRSGDGYHGEMEHRDPQGGSERDGSPQVGEQTQEAHG